MVNIAYVTEAEVEGDDHFSGGGDHEPIKDCHYNETGEWCPSQIHQALEVSWLVLMDISAITFMFYLWFYRDYYSGKPLIIFIIKFLQIQQSNMA